MNLITFQTHHSNVQALVATFAFIGCFFAQNSMNSCFQHTLELLPTEVRGQGAAFVNVVAHAATFFGPYIAISGNPVSLIRLSTEATNNLT